MPTYERECLACGKQAEFFATMAECNNTPTCECGSPTKRVYLSAPMGYVHFPAAGGQGYVSPVTGKYIDTKRAREDDLKRTNSRPYEGRESEMRQAAKNVAHEEKKSDEKLHEAVSSAYHTLSPDQKKVLDN